ncbi:MAG: hypothetical protein Ct9H90mP17_1750 [Actinomycetota bacterium]|nr:MAG: hypothetical protein Ct9H90mP17_1750 [Actinomycetota bacterium]
MLGLVNLVGLNSEIIPIEVGKVIKDFQKRLV